MPDIHVHLCVPDSVRRWPSLHPLVVEAVCRNPRVARIGAVLPDLVGMDPGWWRRTLKQISGDSSWTPLSALAHQRDASTLLLALAQPRASSLLGPLRRLALAAGFASHVVQDRYLDPRVRRRVDEEALADASARQRRFAQIELQQAVALEQFGGLAVAPAEQLLLQSPLHEAAGDRRVIHHINDALQVVTGQRPRPRDWQDWTAGLHRHLRELATRQTSSPASIESEPHWSGLRQDYDASIRATAVALRSLATAFEPGDLLPSALLELSRHNFFDLSLAVDGAVP